jgi:hypothetical protein
MSKKLTPEEKEKQRILKAEEKKEDKKALAAFKDLVKRAREKDALVELILPEGGNHIIPRNI